MKTIRKGNDIVVRWRIFRYGQEYDIALIRESISLVLSNMGEKKEITDYSVVDVNTIVFKYRAEDQGLGIYRLLLIDKSRNSTRIIEECNAFRLVNTSDAANNDDTLESAITITLTSELTAPADGLSAYEVALQNGFIGTEEEWLQSLKGEQGPQGIQGDKGDKGDRGEQGDEGLSAYQVAIANGFVGTEEEWLQSLVPDTTDIELAEAQRQAKELERIEAENTRQSAELERQNASTEAVSSANEAASNANNAAITAQQKAEEANAAASSANAVVDEFKSIIAQETGNAQDKVMSQKAVTDAMIASQEKLSELESTMSDFLPVQYEEKGSGWQLVNLNFSAPEGETLIIKNTGGGTITNLQLKDANENIISETSTSIAPGGDYSLTIPKGLAKLRFYIDSIGVKITILLDIKNLSNKASGVAEEVNNVKAEIGYPAKFNLPISWQSAPYTFVGGKKYYFLNTGTTTIDYLQIKNGESTIAEYSNIAVGVAFEITIPQSGGDSFRVFSSNKNSIFSIYTEESYFYELQQKVSKNSIKQICGNSATDLMSQEAVTNNVDSILIDAPSYLKGIVGFMFFKQVNAGMPDIDEYTQFRISRYYHDSSWYMYLELQILYNGEWIKYGEVGVTMSAAPVNPKQIEKFTSTNGSFMIWVNWSLMGNASQSSLAIPIKNTAINYADRMLYDKQQEIIQAQNNGAYELKDRIKHNIIVDANGGGDFTTIGAAYASIKDSSYMNQYDILVMPGTYNEVGLIPPIYTHTHGMNPQNVIVTSQGLSPKGNPPTFDIIGIGSKLSNMTIISAFGYCIHLDISLGQSVFVAENLICKKDYGADVRNFGWQSSAYSNPTIIGCGSDYGGAKWIFNGCTFIDGWVACHTVPTPGSSQYEDKYANQHFILRNCKLVNAIVQMISLVPSDYIDYGFNVCEITGLYTQKGCTPLQLYYSSVNGVPNIQWQVIGSNNENFCVEFAERSQDGSEFWKAIETIDKTICELASPLTSIEKMQWIKRDNTICHGEESPNEILGVALETISNDYNVPCWVGKAFRIIGADGEYGIGADGKLSASATNKIGYIYKNVFYRYY